MKPKKNQSQSEIDIKNTATWKGRDADHAAAPVGKQELENLCGHHAICCEEREDKAECRALLHSNSHVQGTYVQGKEMGGGENCHTV